MGQQLEEQELCWETEIIKSDDLERRRWGDLIEAIAGKVNIWRN